MLSRSQQNMGAQWSFRRFLVGCSCSFTNYVGGWYFLLNMLACIVSSAMIGITAYVMGVDIMPDDTMQEKMLGIGIIFLSWIIGLFCLWFILWLIVGRMEFPMCKSGCCCGKKDYSYRFGTWLGLTGWRKWMFVCSCGHLYEVHCGRWRCVDDLAADDTD